MCGKQHQLQAFISHSRSDRPLVNKVLEYCCLANVHPFLFEMPFGASASSSNQIMQGLMLSDVYLLLLGPEAAKRGWTQTWMGFECGFFAAKSFATSGGSRTYPNIPSMFLVEDISQDSDSAIPFCQVSLMLDFADPRSWPSVKTLLSLVDHNQPLSRDLLEESNALRLQNLAILDFKCPNPECRGNYEIHLWMGRRARRDSSGIAVPPKRCSLKCSVCRQTANIEVLDMLPGTSKRETRSWRPRPGRLALAHISRLT